MAEGSGVELQAAESMALTIAFTQWREGRPISPNTCAVCMLALARLRGLVDDVYEPIEAAS